MTEKFSHYALSITQFALLLASVACGQLFFEFVEEADTYFLMNLGRYILEHDIPHVDPFTIHENLQLVAQQWLSGVIFWEAYKNFGVNGLLVVDFIIGAAAVLIHWRLCLLVSGNRALSFVLSFVIGLFVTPAIVPRPQLFSAPILLIEVFLLEKFTRTNNFKFLLPLPLISIALVNLHSAVWLMSLVVCLPFLFVKSIRHAKFLLAAMAAIFLCGLINPYSVDAMTYVLRSYGVEIINAHVAEMFSPTAHNVRGKLFYFTAAFLIFSLTKFKVPWRYIFLSGGITFLTLMHIRNWILFCFLATFPIAYAWRNFKPPKFLAKSGALLPIFFLLLFVDTAVVMTLLKDNLEKLSAPLEILLAAAILFLLYNLFVAKFDGRLLHPKILPRKILSLSIVAFVVCVIFFTTMNHGKQVDGDFTAAMKFLLKSERPENISLYADQGYGGLAGMFGVKYYIDSRSEVFIPENNGRKNILSEYLDFKIGKLNYKNFFARYKFTHIFITNATPFIFDELSADKNFRVIYESERVEDYNVVRCKIFVPKNEGNVTLHSDVAPNR